MTDNYSQKNDGLSEIRKTKFYEVLKNAIEETIAEYNKEMTDAPENQEKIKAYEKQMNRKVLLGATFFEVSSTLEALIENKKGFDYLGVFNPELLEKLFDKVTAVYIIESMTGDSYSLNREGLINFLSEYKNEVEERYNEFIKKSAASGVKIIDNPKKYPWFKEEDNIIMTADIDQGDNQNK